MRRKLLIVVILIFAILLQSIMPFTMVYAETGVEITLNSKLYNAVKEELQKKNIVAEYRDANYIIVISQEELAKVTKLNLQNKEIDDLTGLGAFSSVTELNLHANNLTADSNLQELDSLNLTDLDLSSNKLESVKSISKLKEIESVDITDQRIIGREIITVDDSEDAQNYSTKAQVELPDILLEDGGRFDPDWIDRTIYSGDDETNPEIDFESLSLTDNKLVLNVASGTGSNYKALKGLLKVEIKVDDSKSKIANTHMTFYYAIVNQDETGIAFDDENLYNSVKAQLSSNQKINKELNSTTENKNIYDRVYDEALIMVIKTDNVTNEIPSLILNDKMIKDLTGLEKFVGLKSDLNVSYNYIDSIERIIELSNNKDNNEQEIRNKYSKILNELKTVVAEYDEQQKIINSNEEDVSEDKKEEARRIAQGDVTLINKYMTKLYSIYKNEYKLVSLLPVEVNHLSYSGLINSNKENVDKYVSSIMTRISELEKKDALTTFENSAIIKLLTDWGKKHNLTFNTTVKVKTTESESETDKTIEYPISNFFENYVQKDKVLSVDDYKQFIYIFKAIDALSQVESYTIIKRIGESNGNDCAKEALDTIKGNLKDQELDAHFYDLISYNDNITDSTCYLDDSCKEETDKKGYVFDNSSKKELFDVKIGLAKKYYDGEIKEEKDEEEKNVTVADCKLKLAHKLNLVTANDLSSYITLPEIKKLNLANNKISSLKGLETLKELKELNACENLINDIKTDMDWSAFSKIQVLNLGYNQISDIEPLQKINSLRDLNVSYNLLEGAFTFNVSNMRNLKNADFSHNQYSDIKYANDQFILKARGYDGNKDGIADNLTVPEYLEKAGINLSFQYQTLEMYVTVVKTGEQFINIELPLIFRQLEKIDNDKTSFIETTQGGIVEPEGKSVRLIVPKDVGDYKSIVVVDGKNGFDNSYSTDGIGYGTSCTIYYTVVNNEQLPDNPGNPDNPNTPDQPSEDVAPTEYGYSVENGFVLVYKPSTKLSEFATKLVNPDKYGVSITENQSEENIGSGAVASITNKAGDKVYEKLDTVVKGDLNGDADIDA